MAALAASRRIVKSVWGICGAGWGSLDGRDALQWLNRGAGEMLMHWSGAVRGMAAVGLRVNRCVVNVDDEQLTSSCWMLSQAQRLRKCITASRADMGKPHQPPKVHT